MTLLYTVIMHTGCMVVSAAVVIVAPVSLQFLYEGQEEIGSPHLAGLLSQHKKLLAADMALSADGGQITETQATHCSCAE